MERKPYSRRDAVKTLGLTTAAMFGRRILRYEFLKPDRSFRNEEGISRFVQTSGPKYFLTKNPETQEKTRIQVFLNKGAIESAIIQIAETESRKDGIALMGSFLEKSPLKVRLGGNRSKDEWASYRPVNLGGPIVTFKAPLVGALYLAKKNNDHTAEYINDQTVWHELFHIWQDLRAPLKFSLSTLFSNESKSRHSPNYHVRFDPEGDPVEREAWIKAEEMMLSSLAGFMKTGKSRSGQFFRFG